MNTAQTDLLGRQLRALNAVVEWLDEAGDLPYAPDVTLYGHSDRVDVGFHPHVINPGGDPIADARQIMTVVGGLWEKAGTSGATDTYLEHFEDGARFVIFLKTISAECVVCGETPEACGCPERDGNPSDADLAPDWDALPAGERQALNARLHAAIEAGH